MSCVDRRWLFKHFRLICLKIGQCPADRESVYCRSSGCFERLRTLVERRPGGENIINDEDRAVSYSRCIRNMESIFDVCEALQAIQARLRFRRDFPHKNIVTHGKTDPAAKDSCQQPGLVEASLPQSFQMKGDGKNNVWPQRHFPPVTGYQQIRQGPHPMEATAELQLMNPPANHTGMVDG